MQMVLESHAHKLIGLHSWSEKYMYLVLYDCSSYHDQLDLSVALISGLSAAS